jgi:hypothetical protein
LYPSLISNLPEWNCYKQILSVVGKSKEQFRLNSDGCHYA